MRTHRNTALQCLVLVLLALCALVSAQNSASSTQAPASSSAPASSGTTTSAPSASGSNTASASGTTSGNSTISGSSNSTASSTSTTPATFPVASVPSTGYLAGTAAAPVPGGAAGATGTAAMGPNDSHIVSAGQVLRASLPAVSASIVALGVGVWILL